jgi:glycosyltransferase involved in cell wall biosynthesis
VRILFLSKRRPQQRDLIERPYGRFHHLPVALARAGHEVSVLLCSHHHLPREERQLAGVTWHSVDIRTLGLGPFFAELKSRASAFRPDWVIGVSDAQYGFLAQQLARLCKARLAVDAYDNYEAYMPWNLPLHGLWRRAIGKANLVTAAGPQLAEKLQVNRMGAGRVEVLTMAADPAFISMDRAICRQALGLPGSTPLIGYSGGWARNRGTYCLVDSFRQVRVARPDACLVLSGKPPADVCREPGVITLGYLDDAQMPVLLNALDVACVITADTSFGRYSYPAKLWEAMACGIPVVGTATEPVRWMLRGDTRFLAEVGNAQDIAARILNNLDMGRANYGPRPTWSDVGKRLEALLTR